jgi:outer membrane receptor protein involved in Fe transport
MTFRPHALCLTLAIALPVHASQQPDLTALSLEQLLDVTIVGASKYAQKQGEVAAAVSVITRQEIRTFGWRTIDEALASLPGVHTTYNRQSTALGARGFGLPGDFNTRLLVMINGNRVNEPIYDSGLAGQAFPVDMDLIDRIEFIPGPGGAVYGQNAMFGVVNVITRAGEDVGGVEATVAYQNPQSLREGRASWGKLFDNGIDMLVSVSGMNSAGEDLFIDYGASGVEGVAAGMDGERSRRVFAHIKRGPWSLEQAYGARRKEDPTGVYFSDPLVPGQQVDSRLALTQLQYEEKFADDTLQASARLFRGSLQYRTVFSYSGNRFPSDTQSRWHGAEVRLLYTAFDGHKLLLGVEAQDAPRSDQVVPISADREDDILIRSPGYRLGVYAQDELRLSARLTATLGLRVDRNDITGTKASPRTALIWQATPATTVKALYGSAHRAPNAFERDYDDGASLVGNPMLQGERIDTLEMVTDHRIGESLTLRASLYQWTMQHLIALGLHPVSGIPQYQSGDRITARGTELSADKTWESGARLRSSISLQDVARRGGAKLINSPEVLGKLNLSGPLPWGGIRASYELHYETQRLSVGRQLGGYAVSNLALSKDALPRGFDMALGLYNIFDKHYAQPGADFNWQNEFEQDGRSVRLTLGYRF